MNIERERGKCKYPLLFQPLKVNKIVLKNRIISAPLGSNTDKSLSGIGMIIRGTSGSVDDTRMRLTPGIVLQIYFRRLKSEKKFH